MGVQSYLTGLGGRDMAVDLGTANTVIYVRGRGVVLSEPSVVATDLRSGEVRAVGLEAERLAAVAAEDVKVHRPLRGGVSADIAVTVEMLRAFIAKVHDGRFAHPRIVVCVPSGITEADERPILNACRAAGARDPSLIDRTMAAAIGAGIAIDDPDGSLIVDIGAGTTEASVVARGELVADCSVLVGSDDFDRAIYSHLKREHGILVSARSAEELKLEIGSAVRRSPEGRAEVRGQDAESGLARAVAITSEEVRGAIGEPLGRITAAINEAIEGAPPASRGAIMDRGITLAGGGSLLQGLAQHLRSECRMRCGLAESPLTCVAVGAGVSPEEFEAIHRAGQARALPDRKAA